MLKVRYPDGTVVTYNNANLLTRSEGAWTLYVNRGDDKEKEWVCSIQASARVIVEAVSPCRVDQTGSLRAVVSNLRSFTSWGDTELLKGMKRILSDFDARTGQWKD